VPAELDMLVSSMLAKDPGARPTAAAVYEALLPLLLLNQDRAGPGGRNPVRADVRPDHPVGAR
jgi:hypothetical protein